MDENLKKGRMDKRSKLNEKLKKYDPSCRLIISKMQNGVYVFTRMKYAYSFYRKLKQQNVYFC